jgi:hypothetical protein
MTVRVGNDAIREARARSEAFVTCNMAIRPARYQGSCCSEDVLFRGDFRLYWLTRHRATLE